MIDASITLGWAFDTETTPLTTAVLKYLETVHAIVPALWMFEVTNTLCTAERKGRITAGAQAIFLERLRLLPIVIEQRPAVWLAQRILPLARRFRLSAYDAAYLELAMREGLPLATLDDDLRRAASDAGVALVGVE